MPQKQTGTEDDKWAASLHPRGDGHDMTTPVVWRGWRGGVTRRVGTMLLECCGGELGREGVKRAVGGTCSMPKTAHRGRVHGAATSHPRTGRVRRGGFKFGVVLRSDVAGSGSSKRHSVCCFWNLLWCLFLVPTDNSTKRRQSADGESCVRSVVSTGDPLPARSERNTTPFKPPPRTRPVRG